MLRTPGSPPLPSKGEAHSPPSSDSDALLTLLYGELRALSRQFMSRQRGDHTLQPTALVHEAYLKLAARMPEAWERGHFYRSAARAMRQVLVDHARVRNAQKRSGSAEREPLDQVVLQYEQRSLDLLLVDEALTLLEDFDEELARVVELRFFCGLTIPEVAQTLGRSRQVVERRWRSARLWLLDRLNDE